MLESKPVWPPLLKAGVTVNHCSMDCSRCINLPMKIFLKCDPLPPPIVNKKNNWFAHSFKCVNVICTGKGGLFSYIHPVWSAGHKLFHHRLHRLKYAIITQRQLMLNLLVETLNGLKSWLIIFRIRTCLIQYFPC